MTASPFRIEHTAPPVIIVRPAWREPAQVEGDCACAEPSAVYPRAPRPVPRTAARYHLAPGSAVMPLQREWRLVLPPRAPLGPIVFNAAAHQVLSFFQAPRYLADAVTRFDRQWGMSRTRSVIQQLTAAELLVAEDDAPTLDCVQATTLIAWLHTTSACNLRCAYCYLAKTNERMSLEIGQQALAAVFRSARRHDYARVKLKFAGGEPTLNLLLVLQLHEYATRLAERHHLALDAVVLSNGTLLDARKIEQLKANDIRLMISLDGIGAYHDANRSFANGNGSFARVAQSIDRALEHGVIPDISITLTERNLDGLAAVVKYVLERDLPFSLNFCRENDCARSRQDLRGNEEQIIASMLKAYQMIESDLPRRSLLGALVDRASFAAPHVRACGVGRDYMVIDPHGRIAKCQMEITSPVTDIRAEDPLQALRGDPIGLQNPRVEEQEGCRDCEWKYWCAGGCPLATYRATRRYDVKSPNCSIYRTLFPHVLRLEGLRLLKWYGHAQADSRAQTNYPFE